MDEPTLQTEASTGCAIPSCQSISVRLTLTPQQIEHLLAFQRQSNQRTFLITTPKELDLGKRYSQALAMQTSLTDICRQISAAYTNQWREINYR